MVLHQAFAHARSPFRRSKIDVEIVLSPDDQLLLERFISEIQEAAASCAVLMTYHSARRCGFAARLPRPHEAILPYIPLTTGAVASSAFAPFMVPANVSMLSALPYYLTQAKTTMEDVLSNPGASPHRRFAQAVEAAAGPLCAAMTFLVVTLDDLAAISRLQGRDACEAALRRLRSTVASALDGGTPLLIDGEIEFPPTTITIRGMRRSVDMRAQLASYGRTWSVRVQNISQGGFCASGVHGIETNAPVKLTLSSGRELMGSVKWVDGFRAGVRLNSRLLMADPLINQ